jgi:hypothetical protein
MGCRRYSILGTVSLHKHKSGLGWGNFHRTPTVYIHGTNNEYAGKADGGPTCGGCWFGYQPRNTPVA